MIGNKEKEIDFVRPVIFIVGIIIIFALFREMSKLVLPLVLALFLTMLLQPIMAFLRRKKIPNWLAVAFVSILTLFILAIFISIISSTATQVAENGAELVARVNQKLDIFIDWLNDLIGVDLHSQKAKEYISTTLSGKWITDALGSIALFLGSLTGSFFMFALYFVILLSGISNYDEHILFIFGEKHGKAFLKNFEKVMHSIVSYVGTKFLTSFLTGFLFWSICTIFGIQFALFWGFLAFALNFIPSIGSFIATIPPILLGTIYLDSGIAILFYISLLVAVQVVVGNIIDPILMGNRMKLNTLTVILGLVFWGYIWGVAGMLLSVPLMVSLRIILEQNPSTAVIARAMSSTRRRPSQKKE